MTETTQAPMPGRLGRKEFIVLVAGLVAVTPAAGLIGPMGAIVLGAVAGVAGGLVAWWLSRLIRSAESNTSVSSDDLIGDEASVVLAIPAGGLGEVALVRHGERVSLSATAETAIPRGSRVRITQTLTATSVMVAPLEAATPQP